MAKTADDDRPQPRSRRGPRPAPDANRDPMDLPVPRKPGDIAPKAPAVAVVAEIPEPYEPATADDLTAKERGDLAACEAALDVLRVAFWRGGKALRVINAARLYRETHATFDDYITDRWQMERTYAYRLMDAAEIAEPLVVLPMGNKINERQARELVPIAKGHSTQAAVELYLSLAEEVAASNAQNDGSKVKVTADLVRKTANAAIAALPPGTDWDHDTVIHTVRVILGLLPAEPATPDQNGEDEPRSPWFANNASKVATLADKVAGKAHQHPEEARAFAEALRQYAERIDKALTSSK